MLLSRVALACAVSAAAVASVAVAEQRIGAALSLMLLLSLAAAVLSAPQVSRALVAISVALSLQPVLRDAGWVVAVDVAAALIAAAAAVRAPTTWRNVPALLWAPLRLIGGTTVVGRSVRASFSGVPASRAVAVSQGLALGVLLAGLFGALFVTADKAFADLVDRTISFDVSASSLFWRLTLGLLVLATSGALARRPIQQIAGPDPEPAAAPGRTELTIALTFVVAVFAVFVAVQLHVLFGGADYVRATTGLGYGEYARQGFAQLLVVATLTLGVIAVAARQPDRVVRALLGLLALLTLVVLASAYHRLVLVEDAYGLTRVRAAGEALIVWLVLIFALVLVAGASARVARAMPTAMTTLTLAGVLAISLSNPDKRIAQSAVERTKAGKSVDLPYLLGLSADALPTLEQLPAAERNYVLPGLRFELERPDGLAGANWSRSRARRTDARHLSGWRDPLDGRIAVGDLDP